MATDEYALFTGKIKELINVDLRSYKEKQMKRRIESLMNRRGFQSFLAYFNLLATDKQALDEFVDRITINVSEFFRNAERWQVLEQKVLPEILQRNNGNNLRIWSAACSTGEEPYSLAMLLMSSFPHARFNIVATDLDRAVMQRAQSAVYPTDQLAQIPLRFRAKYIIERPGTFEIAPEVRQGVEFRHHNLLADPYPQALDLILCRNVLIYFTDDVKDKLYRQFAASLNVGGVLFVGSTEQIFRSQEYGFRILDSFFYQKV